MKTVSRLLMPFVSVLLLSSTALAKNFCIQCTLVSDNKQIVSNLKVISPLEIQGDDFNGLNVPFENPEPGAFRPQSMFGELVGCVPCPNSPVSPRNKPRDYPLPYTVQPDDPNRPRPFGQP